MDAEARLLILDEPTAVLTDAEARRLLAVCRRLADEGRSVVIITHRLGEVLAGCDRVTVLRGGSVVLAGAAVADHTESSLATLMVGTGEPPLRVATRGPLGLFIQNVTAGRGWVALAIVVFARRRPGWCVLGALLFGLCDAAQFRLQGTATAVPYEVFLALPYLVALLALMIRRPRVSR